MKIWLQNKYVQWVLILLVGIGIGAIFYPTKTIREEEQQKYERQLKKVTEQHQTEVKTMAEKHSQELSVVKTKLEETHRTVDVLRNENHHLKQKVEEGTLKIVKPDGTIVEKTYKKTETEQISKITTSIKDEFTRKVKSIENKWKKIHTERLTKVKKDFDLKIQEKEKEIFELKKSRTVEINKRNFGLSVGILTNKNYYTGVSYDIYGPFFLDLHTESDLEGDFAIGGGIGLRF